jgi:N-acetyl-gamma-glutamylphosphate reductase
MSHVWPFSTGPACVSHGPAGVSGAGRAAKENTLYCEIAEGINSYSVSKHRHMPEIEQGLTEAAGKPVHVSFTPHLINMSRSGLVRGMVVQAGGGARAATHTYVPHAKAGACARRTQS